MDRHLSFRLAVGLVAVVVFGSAVAADPPRSSDAPAKAAAAGGRFPVPEGLDANVSFWRDVYAKWGLGQVALHDTEHLALVYEVVDLPEPVAEGMTTQQKDLVDSRLGALQKRLHAIAARADDPAKLSGDDRALRARIINVAGKGALRDAHQRVRSQRGLRERFRRGLELSGRYDRVFRAVLREAGVPEDLAYLPHVESSFQNHARSSVGAAGMWQFTAPTARHYMRVDRIIDERLDPVVAAQAAARYLGRAYEVLGSWPLAITSYNHGVAGMARARAEHGDDLGRIARHYESPIFGFASRNFYAEFLAAREVASNPERYFGEEIAFKPPLAYDRVMLKHPASTAAIARAYGLDLDELAECNPAWLDAAAKGNAKLAENTAVWLPAGTLRRTGLAKSNVVVAATTLVPTARAEHQGPSGGRANVHVVARGDSLSAIAKRHNTTVNRLLALNGISKSKARSLRPGQKIRLPGGKGASTRRVAARKTHVVGKGDNASLIAARHGVGVKDLLALNGLTPDSVLKPGQRLGIPRKR